MAHVGATKREHQHTDSTAGGQTANQWLLGLPQMETVNFREGGGDGNAERERGGDVRN
jgi:hypothetical protein